MIRTATVRARIDPELKLEVDALLRAQGVSPSEAIELFYRQIKRQRGLSFKAKRPNATTRKVLDQTDRELGLTSFKSKEELFVDLGLR